MLMLFKNGRVLAWAVGGALALLAGMRPAHAVLPIEHWQQPQGAKVYLVANPNLPMVDVQIDLDAGSRRDPARQPGLASAAAGQLDSGVRALPGGQGPQAQALDENQLGQAWADLGASFGASVSADRLSFSLRSLSDPDLLAKAAQLAARQMAHPAFPVAVWRRDREKMVAALRESLTRPGTVAAERYAQAVYSGHPYGWRSTPETLQRIEVADMRRWHAQALRTCRAVVSVVGDVDRQRADALVSTLLAHWPQGGCEPLPAVAEVPPLWQAGLRFAGATVLLILWCRLRGIPLLARDGTAKAGLLSGLLFAAEFCCIYLGLQDTSASRVTAWRAAHRGRRRRDPGQRDQLHRPARPAPGGAPPWPSRPLFAFLPPPWRSRRPWR